MKINLGMLLAESWTDTADSQAWDTRQQPTSTSEATSNSNNEPAPSAGTELILLLLLLFFPECDRYVRVFAIANPSVVCLSVTLVHPTQGVERFGKISSPLCTLAIL